MQCESAIGCFGAHVLEGNFPEGKRILRVTRQASPSAIRLYLYEIRFGGVTEGSYDDMIDSFNSESVRASLETGTSNVPHGDPKHTVTRKKHIKLLFRKPVFSALNWWTGNRLFRVTVCLGSRWGTLLHLSTSTGTGTRASAAALLPAAWHFCTRVE